VFDASFEVFTAVLRFVKVGILWVVTPFNVVV
jgi:hypothetical protein